MLPVLYSGVDLTKAALSLAELGRAAAQVAQPTEAQKETGNYPKGHVRWKGLDLTIETAKGQYRRGVAKDGTPWKTRMMAHYGYIKRTKSEADGDHIDIFLATDDLESEVVFIINQIEPTTGKFDEHKCVLGVTNAARAKELYHDNYQEGWKGFDGVTALTLDQFKWWIEHGNTAKPIRDGLFAKRSSEEGEHWTDRIDEALRAHRREVADECPACPTCGAKGHHARTNGTGNAVCANGHIYTDPDYGKEAEEKKHPFTVAVDLDGTLAVKEEPFDPESIGKPRRHAWKLMNFLQGIKARIIIWTVRGDKQLVADWCRDYGIPYDYINENPDQPEGSSAKVLADVYLDDRGLNAVDLLSALRSLRQRARAAA